MNLLIIGKDASPRILMLAREGSLTATNRHAGDGISIGRIIATHGTGTLSSEMHTVNVLSMQLLIIKIPRRKGIIPNVAFR